MFGGDPRILVARLNLSPHKAKLDLASLGMEREGERKEEEEEKEEL